MISRRAMLKTTAAAIVLPSFARLPAQGEGANGFTLGKLPYDVTALEPSIDAETMTIHHTKHHAAYVNNLNTALAKAPELLKAPLAQTLASLDKVPQEIRTAVQNNGGGHWNHTLFWSIMAPAGKGGEPKGDLLKAIETSFKTVDAFKAALSDAGMKRFGSGWAWVIPGQDAPLQIVSTPNQDNPVMTGGPDPILGVDVWEHAYYLKYQNKRADYLAAWWKVVNWDAVAANYDAAKKG